MVGVGRHETYHGIIHYPFMAPMAEQVRKGVNSKKGCRYGMRLACPKPVVSEREHLLNHSYEVLDNRYINPASIPLCFCFLCDSPSFIPNPQP